MTQPAFPAADDVAVLLESNRRWAQARTAADPAAFARLTAGQAPPFLWIGCSDSRAPAEAIVGLGPGEMFVHRNIANLAEPDDAGARSVLQYAVGVLKVRHVLVVGHYGCGGVLGGLRDDVSGPVHDWLRPVRDLAREHGAELAALPDEAARHARLCELNVLRQVANVAADPAVRDARAEGRAPSIHGWCYGIGDGRLRALHAER